MLKKSRGYNFAKSNSSYFNKGCISHICNTQICKNQMGNLGPLFGLKVLQ